MDMAIGGLICSQMLHVLMMQKSHEARLGRSKHSWDFSNENMGDSIAIEDFMEPKLGKTNGFDRRNRE